MKKPNRVERALFKAFKRYIRITDRFLDSLPREVVK